MQDEGDGSRSVEALRGMPGVCLAAPASAREIERVEAFAGVRLPAPHRALLLSANGLATSWGYQRLFGVGDGPEDIGPWNAHEMWKFAWPGPLDDYMAIGQTGWGDQYAYRLSDLRRGVETIHRLDHFQMEAADVPVADSFESFLRGFPTRECRRPGARSATWSTANSRCSRRCRSSSAWSAPLT